MTGQLGAATVAEVADAIATEDAGRGRLLVELLAAALAAVDPEVAVARALRREGTSDRPTTIVAVGKAAPAMARGAAKVLGSRIVGGIIVSNHVEAVPDSLDLVVTSHPTPDESSLAAGRRMLDLVGGVPDTDELLFLVSGGGSALAEVPAPGLDLADLVETSAVLVRAGIPIQELNLVRTHLSAIKGGRLAAAAAGPAMTILLSDVPATAPYLIASGPTLACPTSPGDALATLRRRGLTDLLPRRVIEVLAADVATPVVGGHYVVAADGSMAAQAAVEAAAERGILASFSPIDLVGDASGMATRALAAATAGEITVFSGETTVDVRGTGRGGRNQEAALAVALEEEGQSTMFAALGTDGVDGPTDAAGGLVDGATAARIRRGGIDPQAALAANDSYPALEAADALIRCGPTGTNVADLWIVDRR